MRKPVITRAIKTLNIHIIGVNVKTCELENRLLPVFESEVPKDESKLLNYLRRMYETDDFKISTIVSKDSVEQTYRMSLSDFIANADVVTSDKDEY